MIATIIQLEYIFPILVWILFVIILSQTGLTTFCCKCTADCDSKKEHLSNNSIQLHPQALFSTFGYEAEL